VEELPAEVRAELFPVEATSQEERASLFEQNLSAIEGLFELIRIEVPIHVDELVESTGLSSSEMLAALVRNGDAQDQPADTGKAVCACSSLVTSFALGSGKER